LCFSQLRRVRAIMSLTAPYTNAMRVRVYNPQYSRLPTNKIRLVRDSIHILKRFASKMPSISGLVRQKRPLAMSLRLLQRRFHLPSHRTLPPLWGQRAIYQLYVLSTDTCWSARSTKPIPGSHQWITGQWKGHRADSHASRHARSGSRCCY
jgi:hypothetical protein